MRLKLTSAAALALFAAFSVTYAFAADRSDPFGRRGVDSHADLREIALQAEKLSDSFRRRFDRALDKTIIDGTKKEKKFEKRAGRLEDALDDVRSAVRGGKKYKQARKRVKRALKHANKLGEAMAQLRLGPEVEGEWRQLVAHLDRLAFFYELTPVRRG